MSKNHRRVVAMDSFESYRPLLFSIAYRMLGSVMEAEDMVQETYLRYQATAEDVQSIKPFLTTVVTRLCLDRLKSAQAKRETYYGPWLPEPLPTHLENPATVDPLNVVSQHESISMAFLVLLENLNPVERAVFLLREVFDYGYDEIAQIVGKEEAACRQLFHRAKQHLASNRPRFKTSKEEHEQLLVKFMQAVGSGNLDDLMGILAENITLWSDGGGIVQAARLPILGRDKVARFVLAIQGKQNYSAEVAEINGWASIILHDETGKLIGVISLDVGNSQIQALRFVVNPNKLGRLQ
ncbi:MAG: RNA polymerase sigma-70 factor [Chloroflexi bacterium]|nr:RNA polymerase sigma-70 factor [Chloroflexota bacterium]